MSQKPLSEFTDEELLQAAKKQKSSAITTAVLIGFLAGIVIYSVAVNSWGWLTLIPLYLIYRLVKQPKDYPNELEALLKERGLK